jgi:hypothetical protein
MSGPTCPLKPLNQQKFSFTSELLARQMLKCVIKEEDGPRLASAFHLHERSSNLEQLSFERQRVHCAIIGVPPFGKLAGD